MFIRRTILRTIVAAFAFACASSELTAADGVQTARLSFQSGGKSIAVERFAPAAGRGRSAIVILHGAGSTLFDGPEMRRIARRLAAGGDEAYFIHYFDRTGTFFGRDSNMRVHFEEWLATVRDAVTWVQAQHGRREPVGVFGYSLGAFLAVAVAADNPRVAAVAEQSGGVWDNQTSRIGRLPPTLLIHGRLDRRVPFDKYAAPLLAVVQRRAPRWETRYFPNEGHVFTAAARAQERAHVAAWFMQMRKKY